MRRLMCIALLGLMSAFARADDINIVLQMPYYTQSPTGRPIIEVYWWTNIYQVRFEVWQPTTTLKATGVDNYDVTFDLWAQKWVGSPAFDRNQPYKIVPRSHNGDFWVGEDDTGAIWKFTVLEEAFSQSGGYAQIWLQGRWKASYIGQAE